jgi:hypothetical protein
MGGNFLAWLIFRWLEATKSISALMHTDYPFCYLGFTYFLHFEESPLAYGGIGDSRRKCPYAARWFTHSEFYEVLINFRTQTRSGMFELGLSRSQLHGKLDDHICRVSWN